MEVLYSWEDWSWSWEDSRLNWALERWRPEEPEGPWDWGGPGGSWPPR